jgi:hypothetical protein
MSRIHPECPGSDPPDRSVVAEASLRLETRSKFYTATSMHKPEFLGSLLPRAPRRSKLGLSFMELEKQVWGVDFPEQADEYEEKD